MGDATLTAVLDGGAARNATKPALVTADETVSYAALRDRAASVAAGLEKLGVGRGDRVALWLPNCVAYVETCFALARLGAVGVAVNTRFRAHEVQDILARSRSRVLMFWPGFKDIDFTAMVGELDRTRLPELRSLVLVGDAAPADDAPAGALTGLPAVPYGTLREAGPRARSSGSADDPCSVFTSSGTTSAPKLVVHTQAGVVVHARNAAWAFGYAEPDVVVLGMLPLCGVFGFDTVLAALAGGATAVLLPVFDAAEAVRLVERHRVTHTNAADEMLWRVLAATRDGGADRIASLREAGFANFTGDARALVAAGDEQGKHFFQTYGASEVHALNCYQPPGTSAERRALGGGVPVSPDYTVRVRDPESGTLLAPGDAGMLEVAGPHVLAGFLGDEDAHRATFTEDGYVRTGDLGYLEDGGFVYLARMGDALRLGGFLVNPREIEAFLEDQPGVGGAQMVGVPTPAGTAAVAFVVAEPVDVPADTARLSEGDLVDACRARLARFKVPRRIVELAEFPTTDSANGVKIRRVELRDRAAELLGKDTT